jgi:nicotinate-nucleotide adenylyltransferase
MNAGRRVGVLGGTFDPPHIGHVAVASAVRTALSLDEVLLVVANDPWQKSGTTSVSAPEDRFAMVSEAVLGVEGVRACSIEIDRGGPSYMVDTLQELRSSEPGIELFLIVGSDAASGLASWHRHDELPALATLVIVDRPGVDPCPHPAGWTVRHVSGPGLDLSSTGLRDELEKGRIPFDALAPSVRRYIVDNDLYAVHRV